MSMILDGTNGVTFNDSSLQAAAASPYVLKNRIINGDMRIDQRNAGASVTPSGDTYTVDRWKYEASQGSKFTIQQNRGSVTPPADFTNYLGYLTASAVSVGTTDFFLHEQYIEGFNTADLNWGTANAKTVTLSFWVRSSLTGTFGGNLQNNANNRFYPFSYTISSANTWEQKSITIAGDTTGTWLTNNGTGILLRFSLGTGSTYLGTAGSWGSTVYLGVTGQTNVVGTLNATWNITGVQLEIGTSATPFERRLYGQELINCQRYYQTLPFDSGYIAPGATISTGAVRGPLFQLNVNMRAAPTVTLPTAGSGSGQLHYTNSSGSVPATIGTNSALGVQVNSFRVEGDGYTSAFTAGQTSLLRIGPSSGASLTASAEL